MLLVLLLAGIVEIRHSFGCIRTFRYGPDIECDSGVGCHYLGLSGTLFRAERSLHFVNFVELLPTKRRSLHSLTSQLQCHLEAHLEAEAEVLEEVEEVVLLAREAVRALQSQLAHFLANALLPGRGGFQQSYGPPASVLGSKIELYVYGDSVD